MNVSGPVSHLGNGTKSDRESIRERGVPREQLMPKDNPLEQCLSFPAQRRRCLGSSPRAVWMVRRRLWVAAEPTKALASYP
jgi:hypothetical protein